MAVIYLIRHGETDGNRSHYIGRRDLPLNSTGKAQADALAGQLADFPIRQIFSSPLLRARQTAKPLAAMLGLPIAEDVRLVEFDFGDLQDLPKEGHTLNLRKDHQRVPVAGGESLLAVWNRLTPFAISLRSGGVGAGDIAVVGHYWSNRLLHGLLHGLSFDETLLVRDFKPQNGTAEAISFRFGA
jgi:2,3-bisphosphoglycerate-dependent phosphoglycerate mutase